MFLFYWTVVLRVIVPKYGQFLIVLWAEFKQRFVFILVFLMLLKQASFLGRLCLFLFNALFLIVNVVNSLFYLFKAFYLLVRNLFFYIDCVLLKLVCVVLLFIKLSLVFRNPVVDLNGFFFERPNVWVLVEANLFFPVFSQIG